MRSHDIIILAGAQERAFITTQQRKCNGEF